MQIGIDVGATKIEYILLHDNGEETGRSRTGFGARRGACRRS